MKSHVVISTIRINIKLSVFPIFLVGFLNEQSFQELPSPSKPFQIPYLKFILASSAAQFYRILSPVIASVSNSDIAIISPIHTL